MAAPKVITREKDASLRVSTSYGISEAIVIPALKGEVGKPMLIEDENMLLKYFTPDERIEVGMHFGYYSALTALLGTNKLWVSRAANKALYGGFYYKKDGTIEQVNQTEVDRPKITFDVTEIKERSKKITISNISKGTIDDLVDKEITIENVMKNKIVSVAGNVATLENAIKSHKPLEETATVTISKVEVEVLGEFNYSGIDPSGETLVIDSISGENFEKKDIKPGVKFTLNGETSVVYTVKTFEDSSSTITITSVFTGINATGTGAVEAFDKELEPEKILSISEITDGSDKVTCSVNKGALTEVIGKTIEINDLGSFTITKAESASITLDKKIDNKFLVNESVGFIEATKLKAEGFEDPSAVPMGDDDVLFIHGCNPGEWNNDIRVKIYKNFVSTRNEQKRDRYGNKLYLDTMGKETTEVTSDPIMVDNEYLFNSIKDPNVQFRIEVYKIDNMVTPIETFDVSRDKKARDGYGQNLYVEDRVKTSNYIRVVNNESIPSDFDIIPMNKSDYEYETMPLYNSSYDESKRYGIFGKMVGGDNGLPVTDSTIISAMQPYRSKLSYDFKILLDGGWSTVAVQKEMTDICERRDDAVAIQSMPFHTQNTYNYLKEMVDYRNIDLNTNSSFTALYTPHVKINDKYNNRDIFISPDGLIGAAISDTERNYELWYPVGGKKRGRLKIALDTFIKFEDGQMDTLYDNGINPIRFYPGEGIMIWGQKTLHAIPSALDRLNTRLMLICIKPAITKTLESFLFELNDDGTRELARNAVSEYMEGVKARKGCLDFKVVCDRTNNTNDDIANYTMNLDLYVVPPYGIDFIKFTTVITRAGANFKLAAEA